MYQHDDFKRMLNEGTSLTSSGTSGNARTFFQTPKKLKAANSVAIDAQELTTSSSVYTVCSLKHAGGLLAQTLPAYSIGAKVDIDIFNAYEFVKKVANYSHTHITPYHAKAILKTKNFYTLDLSKVWVSIGADPVEWSIIESFVKQGATVMCNWGMSEIGPVAINSVFRSVQDVEDAKQHTVTFSTLMGNRFYCDYKLVNNQLYVKGDICIFDDWYDTKDLAYVNNGYMFYTGRSGMAIDLTVSKKGAIHA
jgi:hypothetical protein